jgi:hypothetical protein
MAESCCGKPARTAGGRREMTRNLRALVATGALLGALFAAALDLVASNVLTTAP